MRLGIQLGFERGMNLPKGGEYQMLSEAGFSSIDYALANSYTDSLWQMTDKELEDRMIQIRDTIHKNGMRVGQTHSPLDAYWNGNPTTKEARWKAQVQAIKAASFLESPYIVIHPIGETSRVDRETYERVKAMNMEYYNYLKPYLEAYNVKCAIENLFSYDKVLGRYCKTVFSTADDLKDYIDTLGSDRFVACLDVGHAFLSYQDPVEMVYALGKKYLHVTHIHDNCGYEDSHFIPGAGKIDWYAIGKALNDIGYDGVFSYEASASYFRFGENGKILMPELIRLFAEIGKVITKAR